MRVVTYLRVSSATQLDGYGLDIQEQACRAYADLHGFEIKRTLVDGAVSGTLEAELRPGLTEALQCLADDEADVLLAARLDRVARAVGVQEAILARVWRLRNGACQLHTADVGCVHQDDPEDPMRTAMRQMASVFAQLDKGLIVKRLRNGRQRKAAQGGKAVGSYPYGWSKDGPIPEEQDIRRRAEDLRETLTLAQVVDALNTDGVTTRHGRPWSIRTLHNVLTHPNVPTSGAGVGA